MQRVSVEGKPTTAVVPVLYFENVFTSAFVARP